MTNKTPVSGSRDQSEAPADHSWAHDWSRDQETGLSLVADPQLGVLCGDVHFVQN